ncbi:GPI-anchored cell wall organization protein Ecm33 [Elsinoe ampelina]|uniref:GPI-anchored cell wall organization protein Ecm33 n=1 Tax=Elsinoe ampelina TaxID=302913 RepID=A0A6A6GD27_9PEZI|nr:GPI-anchored cell wall organization protein Ecm33 [Elsinoe ampelina]
MFSKTAILPVLAIAGRAAAQCSSSGTFTIQNQGDAGRLSGCQTYTGNIAIQTGVTSDISLDGVRSISGDLIADNAVGLPSLTANSLETIGGTFGLTNMTLLTSLSFPRLTEVGTLVWQTLPRLSSLGFTTGVRRADSVRIIDTQLGSLDGINLETVGEFYISNNNQLNEIDMQVEQVTGAWNIEFNGRNTSVNLPNLENAFNMTFRNVSSISIPSLASVNSSLGFWGGLYDTIAGPNLTSVGGSLVFVSNRALTNVSFPRLTQVRGALLVANNTEYDIIDGFPAVSTVGGAVDFYGNFTDVQLPALTNVAGAFNLQSSADIQQVCDRFNPLRGRDNVIKGAYTCFGQQRNPGGVGTPASSGSTSSQSGAGAKELYARSSAVTGVLGVFAAMLGML